MSAGSNDSPFKPGDLVCRKRGGPPLPVVAANPGQVVIDCAGAYKISRPGDHRLATAEDVATYRRRDADQ